ncbi:CPXCG motif-containing cysteine-rich protein [Aestuariibacter sp. AA17]|uniref:CPXCG motif-containing cysteine-rich protein n=1 Tax=Fluctibacter corallii TaxID=2984329 RepID=A0ABT3A4Q4_9ALTE|nr:CPXCG motif-containing cysteine-rich protein [Aestuariibacter sp. AA17]MCV2883366.1 CPXCG motif-containing cysteine-rich protein [Aestuariibacter sp. AA17]
MSLGHAASFQCPYCMEPNDLDIDPLNDIGQVMLVDCQICCQPIEVRVEATEHDDFVISVKQENE